jgi:hypothetical protein
MAKQPGAVQSKLAIDAKLLQAVSKARSQAKTTRATLKLPAADEAKAVELYKSLSAPQRAALSRMAGKILAGAAKNDGNLSPKLGDAIRADVKLFPKTSAQLLAIASFRASVALAASRLEAAAKKLDDQRERVRRLRESIADLRDVLADWGKASSQSVSWTEASGQRITQTLTRSATQAVLDRLQTELTQGMDSAGLMEMDLQRAMQHQERGSKLLSKLLKANHDAVKAVINNIR